MPFLLFVKTPAPSGIPVASTASVVIGNAGAGNNGTYVKKVPQQLLTEPGSVGLYIDIAGACYSLNNRLLLSPNAQIWEDVDFGSPKFGAPFGSWKLIYAYYEGGDISDWGFTEIASNASTNTSYIPDTGWSPSLTITAPAGIPVASTSIISLNNAFAYYQSQLGPGYFLGNPQSFSKINSYTYFDGSLNYIRHIGYWQWYWDNGDNSYNLIDLTSATDPNFIPNDWGNGITITAVSIGLPVASTDSIIVSGLTEGFSELNGTYSRSAWTGNGGGALSGASIVYYNPNYTGGDKNGAAIWWRNNESRWKFTYYNDNVQILSSSILGLSASHLPSTSTDWLAGTSENYNAGLTKLWTGSINITAA